MKIYDIRDDNDGYVDAIKFADNSLVEATWHDETEKEYGPCEVVIRNDCEKGFNHIVLSTHEIPNLIKALNKALELGWNK